MTYNRIFTLHGVVMIWLFMIPAIPSALRQLLPADHAGRRGRGVPAAEPRSASTSTSLGAVIALVGHDRRRRRHRLDVLHALQHHHARRTVAAHPARRLHHRLLVDPHRPQLHRHRPHAARARAHLDALPLFVWAIYATRSSRCWRRRCSASTLLLVAVEHAFGFGIFDPARGGDPVLFQHLFWFYSHPAVYIMVLPAMGVISRGGLPPSRARTSSATRRSPYSSLGIAFVGFFTWGHHMFVVGPVDLRRRRVRRPLDVRGRSSPPSRSSTGSARSTRARSASRRRSPTSSASSSSSSSAA